MAITSIRNNTPNTLNLTGVGGEHLKLAPLQELPFQDEGTFFFDELEREGCVSPGGEIPKEAGERIAVWLFGGGFWVVIGAVVLSAAGPFWGLSQQAWTFTVWVVAIGLLALVLIVQVIRATNSGTLVARFTMQLAALSVILAIGVGLPAAAIYWFGCGAELLEVPAANPLGLYGRLLQLSFIAVASLLPVLLFFLFDRYQLATLRKRLHLDLFRLDPTVSTVGEINAKYGSQIEEAYGAEDQKGGRLAPGSRGPVLVCAFVITIGWIITLAPVGLGFAPANAGEVLSALTPEPAPIVYGFLGAYFLSLRTIALRYARGDLKPKAYSHIMVRILIVVVLSWVLDAMFAENEWYVLLLAFLFGILPDEFFTWLREGSRNQAVPLLAKLKELKLVPAGVIPEPPKLPLTDLDGIDLYDRSRLESEGIVNIEGLAHHELIDLIIETRVSVPRLIDWMDQAILYLHLAGGSKPAEARTKLRDYGIRCATDLLRTWDRAHTRGRQNAGEFDAFRKLLGDTSPPYRLEVIRDAMLDDEWMDTVSNWRKNAKRPPLDKVAVPTTVEDLQWFALTQKEKGRYGTAIEILERSLALRDTAETRLELAALLAESPADWQQAHLHATQAESLAPDDLDAIERLMGIYESMEEYGTALRLCDQGLSIISTWPDGTRKKNQQKRLEGTRVALQAKEQASSQNAGT